MATPRFHSSFPHRTKPTDRFEPTKAFLREEGGTRSVTEGACATLKFDETLPQRALPQSPAAPAPSRREPFVSSQRQKHHQRKFLGGVRVFSAKNAETKGVVFVLGGCKFAREGVHQTLSRSLNLLSQVSVLLRTAHRGQYRSKSVEYLCRYAKRRCRFGVLGARAFSSPQNFDSPFGLPQDDTLTLESPPASYLDSKVPKTALAVFGTAVHLLPASIPSLSPENGSFRQYGFFGGQRGLSFPKESPLISYPYIFTSVTNVTIIGLRLVFW